MSRLRLRSGIWPGYFVPDPQTFALPLDTSAVSNGVPAAGAGNLETRASTDVYTFTVPSGGKTFLNWQSCAANNPAFTQNGLNWQIISAADGSKAASGYCRDGNKSIAL